MFKPTWKSLQAYRVPEWYMDAKFGIFIHWGVYAVPAYDNEWYPRNMYRKESHVFRYHRERWGPQSVFGYKDFIPLFKAERWAPHSWVSLFAEAGARYVVPVAEHHDGFAMYASEYTPWNAANMGPRKDIIAELKRVVEEHGLKFGVSTHRAFNWRYYTYEDDYDTTNPAYSGLYSPPHPEKAPASREFLEDWFARTKELIDKFAPDLLWFDFGWHSDEFSEYRPRIVAYFYNRALALEKEVVLNYKDKLPDGVAVLDIERGKLSGIREHYWQTDTSVSTKSWGYIKDDQFKTPTTLVHDLVDIVSKNGNLLLNIGPRPDGTIPKQAADILRAIGRWLAVNGEAIYGTRPWKVYGEGPTEVQTGHLTEQKNEQFTAQDVRFTTKPGALYATCLGWPGNQAKVVSLGRKSPHALPEGQIARISMLGSQEPLRWSVQDDALYIATPQKKPCDHAYCFKIELKR